MRVVWARVIQQKWELLIYEVHKYWGYTIVLSMKWIRNREWVQMRDTEKSGKNDKK